MKRNAFGQLILPPHILSFNDEPGGGGGGDGKPFTPPASQEELDKLINGAVARTHKQYEPIKEKASKWDTHEAELQNKPKPEPKPEPKPDGAPAGVSEDDVDKRISEALAAERLELALERVNDGLDKALEGRTYAASKLFNLDRKQFVKEDGKTVDTAALQKWVQDNSTEAEQGDGKRRRTLRAQGERDSNATGGSVSAGRDLYDETHQKKSSGKD